MITSDYAIFRRFSDFEQAKQFAAKLMENNIDCLFEGNPSLADMIFPGATLQNEVHLIVKRTDLEKANSVFKSDTEQLKVAKDHYLFDFTNEELYEVLMKPDEWNSYDYTVAQNILKDRGENINEELIASLQKRRLEILAQPEPDQQIWVYIGYLSALLGGIVGICIGWYLWNNKKTIPERGKMYAFTENDRKHGRTIFFIGLLVLPLEIVLAIFA